MLISAATRIKALRERKSYIEKIFLTLTPEAIGKLKYRSIVRVNEVQSKGLVKYQYVEEMLHNMMESYKEVCTELEKWTSTTEDPIMEYSIFNLYNNDISFNEKLGVNEEIITKILRPDREKKIDVEKSPIIILSPINDKVLKYLSENPEAFYQLSDNDFENVMAEIYSKLGYDVTRTQLTRDGGKDIIIRKTELLGDFIYYVECKKYAPKRHVGVGIVRNLVGTINTDRVNGGILVTTSFFTRDARKYVLDNKWNYQIKMHDYDAIQKILKGIL